ncbi:MAG: tetratricopeptide repeat protein [Candidatus Aureabacteria bacterium]|nr:tetratricopeptide repeat protein [Candidatus Auribacterota bacterium]
MANDKSGMGKAHYHMGNYAEAEKYFLESNDFDALGDMYFTLRRFDKAHECFLKVGNKVKALQALREKNDREKKDAVEYCEKALLEGEMEAELRLQLGEIYRNLKRFDEAKAQFEKVRGMDEMEEEALYHLGRLAFDSGDYQGSIGYYQELLTLYPDTKYRQRALKSIKSVAIYKKLMEKNS